MRRNSGTRLAMRHQSQAGREPGRCRRQCPRSSNDELIELAREITSHPPAREMDMLLSPASRNPSALWQWPFRRWESRPSVLRVPRSGSSPILPTPRPVFAAFPPIGCVALLEQGKIVIAAGFQGIDEDFNITTLGRGGQATRLPLSWRQFFRPIFVKSSRMSKESFRPILELCPSA